MSSADQIAVWAPIPDRVTLAIAPRGESGRVEVAMERDADDWWRPVDLPEEFADGVFDYGFVLDGADTVLPDPRSRRQPRGVHEMSRTFDGSAYQWGDDTWTGRQLAGGVIYELHVGTFTPEGTLVAAIGQLDHLVALGVDFVEIMPVNAFNGTRNWGYDGVLWYAVQEEYGGPEGYLQFVDACHQRNLGVIQDVVYNHLGPSGNYLSQYGPYMVAGQGNSWGDSVNLDGEASDEVRAYIIGNAMMWLRDYHVDGLRLDAVHALVDTRATHLLEELAIETQALSAFVGRPLSLIAESDLNDPRLITTREGGGYGLTAQWSDDFHHALYVSLTGDATGYYADFDSLDALAKVFENGFFHDGTKSTFRGRSHGNKIDTQHTPTWRLVVCSDNHDQIGNRALGERLATKISFQQLGLAAVMTVLSPFTPMIFMGEEWGASTPWQFFTSHPEPELAQAVAEGRLEEFAGMEWGTTEVPDPQDMETFARSRLNWSEVSEGDHAALLALHARLLEIRRAYPDLTDPRFELGVATSSDADGWLLIERGDVVLLVNFRDKQVDVALPFGVSELLVVGRATVQDQCASLASSSALVAVRAR